MRNKCFLDERAVVVVRDLGDERGGQAAQQSKGADLHFFDFLESPSRIRSRRREARSSEDMTRVARRNRGASIKEGGSRFGGDRRGV